MPITLTITANTLAEALAALGDRPIPLPVYDYGQQIGGPPIEETTFGPLPAPVSHPLPVATEQVEPAPRRPGRPRKDGSPAQPKPPEPPQEAKPAVFTVRRYGGTIEGEFADSGTAAEVLIGLIREAGDIEALNALLLANDEVAHWPHERRLEIAEASRVAAAEIEQAAAAGATEQAPPATAPGPHFALDGTVLKALTANKQGAMHGVNAVVATGDDGFEAAQAFLKSLGVERVSVLAADDERHAKIARWCAARLNLPVTAEGLV